MTTLNEQERLAINTFLAERWAEFCRHAENYLSEDQIADLEDNLDNP